MSFGGGIAFIFGLIIGSFLNVVLLRMHTGKSLAGRSGCLSCGTQLHARDLIPVVSFFLLDKRCRYCGSRISWQYPLVELLSGAAFLFVYYHAGISLRGFWEIVILLLFILAAVYDIRHHIIPDSFIILLLVSAFGYRYALLTSAPSLSWLFSLGEAAIFAAAPFAALWLFSRGRLIGLADAKLAAIMGIIVGAGGAFIAMGLAAVLGAVVSIGFLVVRQLCITGFTRGLSRGIMKSEVPFGPFLIIALVAVWFGGFGEWYIHLIWGI